MIGPKSMSTSLSCPGFRIYERESKNEENLIKGVRVKYGYMLKWLMEKLTF